MPIWVKSRIQTLVTSINTAYARTRSCFKDKAFVRKMGFFKYTDISLHLILSMGS